MAIRKSDEDINQANQTANDNVATLTPAPGFVAPVQTIKINRAEQIAEIIISDLNTRK